YLNNPQYIIPFFAAKMKLGITGHLSYTLLLLSGYLLLLYKFIDSKIIKAFISAFVFIYVGFYSYFNHYSIHRFPDFLQLLFVAVGLLLFCYKTYTAINNTKWFIIILFVALPVFLNTVFYGLHRFTM